MPPVPPLSKYLGHDAEYQRRRAKGLNGWNDDASLQQTVAGLDSFLAELSLPSGASLIELGCGAGDLSLHFAARGFHVTGIDIAPYAIDWAREKASQLPVNATFLTADLTRDLDPPPPPADIVLDGHCLHCLIGNDRRAFLQNARRCLKSTGIFHVRSMCNHPPPTQVQHFDPVSRCIIHNGIATRYLGTAESILQELLDADFQIASEQLLLSQSPDDADCLLVNAFSRQGEIRR